MARKKEPLTLGCDLGGTSWKINLLRGRAALLEETFQIPSLVEQGPDVCLEQLRRGTEQVLSMLKLSLAEVQLVGVDSPGPATYDGVLWQSPNLRHPKWPQFPLRAAVEQLFKKPTSYTNDCNAAALGEFSTLASANHDLLLVAPGTGLGGGAVIKGRLVNGTTGAAMEVGHLEMPSSVLKEAEIEQVPRCGCKRYNCYETVVSMHGLSFQLKQALKSSKLSKKRNPWAVFRKHPLHDSRLKGLARARSLLSLGSGGDTLAMALFKQQAVVLGALISQVTLLLDHDLTRIGGGLAAGSDSFREQFLSDVIESTKTRLYAHQSQRLVDGTSKIEFAKLGARAGAIGAALFAIETL